MQCPKCSSQMQEDKHLQALGSEVELVSSSAFLGDKIKVFYCENCGYIESYRDKKRRP
jgi:predicted nucleic-acid-binding Zn-ribbon protein